MMSEFISLWVLEWGNQLAWLHIVMLSCLSNSDFIKADFNEGRREHRILVWITQTCLESFITFEPLQSLLIHNEGVIEVYVLGWRHNSIGRVLS